VDKLCCTLLLSGLSSGKEFGEGSGSRMINTAKEEADIMVLDNFPIVPDLFKQILAEEIEFVDAEVEVVKESVDIIGELAKRTSPPST